MARDPPSPPSLPSPLDNTQLRGIPLRPSNVRSAKITIIHPQLRDLILPLERGRVLYPKGMSIEEQRWVPQDDQDDGAGSESARMKSGITGTTKPLYKLDFVPNCLTASRGLLGCGGQHGELYICDLPQSTSPDPLTARFHTSAPKYRPFTIKTTLPGRSINNSIVIPPSWPERWTKTASTKHIGYVGRGSRRWDEVSEGSDSRGRTVDGEWVTTKSTPGIQLTRQGAVRKSREPTVEEEDDDAGDLDDGMDLSDIDDDGETEILTDDDDDDEPSLIETVRSPTSPVATYPNTVPFLHAPRLPHLSIGHPSSPYRSSTSSPHRLLQSIDADRSRRYGHPPPQYVTSRPQSMHSAHTASPRSSSRPFTCHKSNYKERLIPSVQVTPDEPRMLISNNDCTVKMFSLRPFTPQASQVGETLLTEPISARTASSGISTSILRRAVANERDALGSRSLDRLGRGSTNHAFTWERADASSTRSGGTIASTARDSLSIAEHQTGVLQRELARATEQLREEQENLVRNRADFERIIGMRVGDAAGSLAGPEDREAREERRLSRVGGVKFRVATNHSSLSPDLKTMVSVGDSTEVNVFEVIDGGREFRKIAVYNAATDAGFSTSWSKDGRKFAVASQDGQVTVWDHRSSRPLAIFYTSPNRPEPTSPSFLNDIAAHHRSLSPEPDDGAGEWQTVGPNGMTLRDPVTGTPRTGRSTSGREAARVVKFSPEGSGRDLLVFSEENSNIHIIDAQTFNTHILLPVPHLLPGSTGLGPQDESEATNRPTASSRTARPGVEGGTYGIAGINFDPTGEWLYSGTERTVVEWDLRREGYGAGGGGTWAMA